MLYPESRQLLHWAHMQLVKNDLVAWTSGNVSMRLPGSNMILIKPSGVLYEDLDENAYVVVGLDGEVVEKGTYGRPSTDTAAHLFIYNNRADVKAIVHTHSPYVCAWATTGWQPPVALTEIADVFGESLVTDSKVASIGDSDMGERFCLYNTNALILRCHGLLAAGGTVRQAVQRAVMAEHACKTMAIAASLRGNFHNIEPLSDEAIEANNKRYAFSYGQDQP